MAEESQRGVEAEREPNFLLARLERRLLPWAAGRLPRWILPDDMTALGVAAALGVCALGLGLDFRLLELNLTVFDVIGLGIVALMLALLGVRVCGNLRELAKEEPSAPRR